MGQSRISTHWVCCRSGLAAIAAGRQADLLQAAAGGGRHWRWNSSNWPFAAREELPEHARRPDQPQSAFARRDEQAQVYFNQVAGRFDRSYGPGRSWQAFGHLLLRILPPLVVADLGSGEGLVERIAGAPGEKSHCRGQLGEDGGLRREQGEKERAEKPRIPAGRSGESAHRTASALIW